MQVTVTRRVNRLSHEQQEVEVNVRKEILIEPASPVRSWSKYLTNSSAERQTAGWKKREVPRKNVSFLRLYLSSLKPGSRRRTESDVVVKYSHKLVKSRTIKLGWKREKKCKKKRKKSQL